MSILLRCSGCGGGSGVLFSRASWQRRRVFLMSGPAEKNNLFGDITMFRQMLYPSLAALGLLWMGSTASAQSFYPAFSPAYRHGHSHGHHFHVQYRQSHWEERTFSHRNEARRFEEVKESQGF